MVESIVGADYSEADAVVIGVPYENTASFGGGAVQGPEKVREVLDGQIELYDRYLHNIPCHDHKFSYTTLDVAALTPEKMVERVSQFLETENRFFVLVGGVHSVSIPAFKTLAKKHNPEDITIVQLDAHFDLRDDDSEYNDTNPSKYAHSTVMRRAHELGYNILPVGIRTMFKEEHDYAKEHNINYFEWGRMDKKQPTIDEVIDAIQTKKVYLTIDIDGFDPSVMPGTGTPVSGGLSWEYGEALVRKIMTTKEVVAADVVEVAPQESTGQTEYNSAQLVYHILANAL